MTAAQLADLYVQHWPAVFGYVAKRMRGYDDAVIEDIASEVFLRACRGTYRDQGTPLGWLFQIASRLVIDWRRRSANRSCVVPTTVVDLYRSQTDAGTTAHAEAIDLHAALARLPDHQRQHLDAVYRDGLSDEELGRQHGVGKKTSWGRRHRVLGRLAGELRGDVPCSE